MIQPHVPIPADEIARRKEKRTPRADWVSDAVFRAASIPGGMRTPSKKNVKTCFNVRHLAVHPEYPPREFVIHAGLNQLVPHYVGTFTLESAASILATCAEAIMWVVDRPRRANAAIVAVAQSVSENFHTLVDSHFSFPEGSPLRPRPPDDS